jgi:hypothetical protein
MEKKGPVSRLTPTLGRGEVGKKGLKKKRTSPVELFFRSPPWFPAVRTDG